MDKTLSVTEALEVLRVPFRSPAHRYRIGGLAAGVCLAFVAGDVALSSVFTALFDARDPGGRVYLEFAGYAARLLVALAGVALLVRTGLASTGVFGFRSSPRADAVWTLRAVVTGTMAVTLLASGAVAVLLATGHGIPPPPFEGPVVGSRVVALAVLALVAAPLMEEVVYRSLLIPALESFLPSWTAILTGAAVFAWLHVVPYGHGGLGAAPFVGGILTGLAFVQRRSWLSAAIVHAAGNAWLGLALLAHGWLYEITR